MMRFVTSSRSENGYGFERLGLKTGVKNDIFWSEFGEPGGTPPTRIPRSTPPPGLHVLDSPFPRLQNLLSSSLPVGTGGRSVGRTMTS